MSRRIRFSEPYLMGRDLENAIVREFTNDAFSSLDSIPTKKYEQALLTETQKHGDIGMNQMVDNIVRDEKRNFDEAVKRVRKSYIYIRQTDINQIYYKFLSVITKGLKNAATRMAEVRKI